VYHLLEQRLREIDTHQLHPYLRNARTGLEKESLRVSPDGRLSQTAHPSVLGAALTHPWITTDYAESLLELITPPQERATQALDFLLNVETFVYQQLDQELLWTTSMPCVLAGEDDIRIAEYGSSNAGRMKHIYREGLAWRYGKAMQVIAGIHFNYSIDDAFWQPWQQVQGDTGELRTFRDAQYMGLVRNLQRYGWLIIYLFGTSPAICKSFLGGRTPPEGMEAFNAYTLYEPFGTSLRMGNIGYTNSKENKTGVKVCYNTLESYVSSLRHAIATPCAEYAEIGVKVDGEYRQLNANILQIENEYYSTVRPKQPLQGFEKPSDALEKRGIAYVELRSIDVNAFHPAGLTHQQLFFLEVFMHFCLLQDSPLVSAEEFAAINQNQMLTAHRGRDPEVRLSCLGKSVLLKRGTCCKRCAPSPRCLMRCIRKSATPIAWITRFNWSTTLTSRRQHGCWPRCRRSRKVSSPLRGASRKNTAIISYNAHLIRHWRRHFSSKRSSLSRQQAIEASEKMDFDTFLNAYLSGTLDDKKN